MKPLPRKLISTSISLVSNACPHVLHVHCTAARIVTYLYYSCRYGTHTNMYIRTRTFIAMTGGAFLNAYYVNSYNLPFYGPSILCSTEYTTNSASLSDILSALSDPLTCHVTHLATLAATRLTWLLWRPRDSPGYSGDHVTHLATLATT